LLFQFKVGVEVAFQQSLEGFGLEEGIVVGPVLAKPSGIGEGIVMGPAVAAGTEADAVPRLES
jgi:hypothetical protein